MKNLIDAILAGNKSFSHGERVKVINNSTGGHAYPIGGIGTINNTNQQIGFKQYQIVIPGGDNGGWWIHENDIQKVDIKRNKSETLKDLAILIDILDSVSDDEFEKTDAKKLNKKYKSFKFLKLFNNAKTEAEKLAVLEEIME